ncbi:single insulin-like growth factor-binding domain protein-2 [Parasteatoda tepidariorum]|uniref:single insulin-like growth factor-binding domain protein-2 n=1 Tax=Parasteatoda tepidariorum TaxID=114398 RepID=UPI001C728821|nr:single insulin-like growth factor-binding domain protein-2 [Parasteatoda tepidariorum]
MKIAGFYLLLTLTLSICEEDFYCECDDECPEMEYCEFGEVPDVCECCFMCAKGEGESCGGMYGLAGTCAWGLYCQAHPKYPQLPGLCVS